MSSYEERWFVNREKKYKGFLKLLQPQTRQAIMAIEANKDMGKTWLVNKIERYCQQLTDAPLVVAKIDFSNPRQIHKIQDQIGLIRVLRNQFKQPEYFYQLNAAINAYSQANPSPKVGNPLTSLARQIEALFDLETLQNLTFDLNIKYDNLAGQTLQAKVRSLLQYCEQNNMLAPLIGLLGDLRPQVDWETLQPPTTLSISAPAISNSQGESIKDNNAILVFDSDIEKQHVERKLNELFFEAVAMMMAEKGIVVFLFDAYERIPLEAEKWLYQELLVRLRDNQIKDAVIILTGRRTPDLSDLDIRHLLVQTKLEPFSEDYIREYMEEKRQITGLDLRTITITSGGVPGELAMMADRAMATVDEEDDFFSDL